MSQSLKAQGMKVSQRIAISDNPTVVMGRKVMALRPDTMSLAQGFVYWSPPPLALAKLQKELAVNPSISVYGDDEGMPALRQALVKKIQERNGLKNYRVMVTNGGNQAFVNVLITLCDESDHVVLFRPYYFDHHIAITMTGGTGRIIYAPCCERTQHPDIGELRKILSGGEDGDAPIPKLVVLVNPNNPTGACLDRAEVDAIADACGAAGSWLVVDNTYEDFLYDDRSSYCPSGPHIINLFSFSKAYGMMGWRVGYIAYPDLDGSDVLGQQLIKVQDAVAICTSQASQHLALAALDTGREYVDDLVAGLKENRTALLDALSPLGAYGEGNVSGGEGGIFLWAKLPAGCEDDIAAATWLVVQAGVAVIPGGSCGSPGFIRCSFGNLHPDKFKEAAARLRKGLAHMKAHGLTAMSNA